MSDSQNINPYQPPAGELERPESSEHLYVLLSRVAKGTAYPSEAHMFILQGLEFAKKHVQREPTVPENFDAVDLSWCLHDLAMRKFGESARDQLEHWNIRTTRDFGEVVYQLVNAGLMRAEERDKIEDFDNVFEFADEFNPEQFGSTIIEE